MPSILLFPPCTILCSDYVYRHLFPVFLFPHATPRTIRWTMGQAPPTARSGIARLSMTLLTSSRPLHHIGDGTLAMDPPHFLEALAPSPAEPMPPHARSSVTSQKKHDPRCRFALLHDIQKQAMESLDPHQPGGCGALRDCSSLQPSYRTMARNGCLEPGLSVSMPPMRLGTSHCGRQTTPVSPVWVFRTQSLLRCQRRRPLRDDYLVGHDWAVRERNRAADRGMIRAAGCAT